MGVKAIVVSTVEPWFTWKGNRNSKRKDGGFHCKYVCSSTMWNIYCGIYEMVSGYWFLAKNYAALHAKKPRLHPGARRRVGSRQSRRFKGERSLGKGSTVSPLFLHNFSFSVFRDFVPLVTGNLWPQKRGICCLPTRKISPHQTCATKTQKKRKTNPTSSTPPKKQRETKPSTPKRLGGVSVPSRSSCKETSASPRSRKKSWLATKPPLWRRNWKRRRSLNEGCGWRRGIVPKCQWDGIENRGWRRWWNVRIFCSCLFFEMHRRCCGRLGSFWLQQGERGVNKIWSEYARTQCSCFSCACFSGLLVCWWYVVNSQEVAGAYKSQSIYIARSSRCYPNL